MQFKSGGSEGQDGKAFVKLGDKESVRGIFRGDVHEYYSHFGQAQGRSSVCPGDGCEICAKGDKPRFRFRLNFVVKEGGTYVAKIFEQGWKVYQSLKNLHESGFDLEKTVVIITRYGATKNDTSYQILPDPKAKFDGALAQAIERVPLLPLEDGAQVEPAQAGRSEQDANEDMSF